MMLKNNLAPHYEGERGNEAAESSGTISFANPINRDTVATG